MEGLTGFELRFHVRLVVRIRKTRLIGDLWGEDELTRNRLKQTEVDYAAHGDSAKEPRKLPGSKNVRVAGVKFAP